MEGCNDVLCTDWKSDGAVKIGEGILCKERAFNEAAGFTKEHDHLPEFMKHELLSPHDQLYAMFNSVLNSVCGEM
jgi:aldehyde:ferredoxin oxidoreductase